MAKRLLTSSNFYYALFVVIVGAILNFVSGNLIKLLYPDRTTINDFLFDHLPIINWTQYLTDIFVLVAFVIVLFYFLKFEIKYLPYAMMAFGVFYLLRAVLVLLNPFGGYWGNEMTYGISSIKQYGAFPSGHTGFMVVAYMLSSTMKSQFFRVLLWAMVLGEVAALLLSRGHYSIDIVGGLLLGYFVVSELKKRKEKLVL